MGTPAKARAVELVHWMSDRRRAIVVIANLVILRLWFADALDVRSIRSPHDDELYVSHAASITEGAWLGSFDDLTLVKSPGYPIYLAFVSFAPVPLLVVEHALYLAAGALMVIALWPVAERRWLGAGYAVFACNPLLFAEPQTQLTRDLFYSSMTVALLGALVAMLVRRSGPTRPLVVWGLVAGVALATLAITREDTLWIVPTVLLALVPVGAARLRVDGSRVGVATVARAYAVTMLPFVVTLGAVLVVSAQNRAEYGEFVVVDLEDPDYRAALGSLLRVEGEREIDYVPLPFDARAALAENVDRYAEIAPGVEQWVGTGCASFAPACDDLTSAHFEWAVRYGTRLAGHYDSPATAKAFYRALATDVDRACASGQLRCRSGPGSLIGDLDGDDVGDVVASVGESFRWLISPDPASPNDRRGTLPYSGDVVQIVNRDWVEVGLSTDEVRLFGWVHDIAVQPTDQLTVVVTPTVGDSGPAAVVETARLDSPDVAAALGDPSAGKARFDLVIDCGSACVAEFRYGPVVAMRLDIEGRESPLPSFEPGATGAIDFTTRGPESRFAQDARLAMIDGWLWLADLVFAPLVLAWAAATAVLARRRGVQVVGVLALLVVVVAIGSRLALVGVVDALLFDAIRPSYLLPAAVAAYALPMVLSAVPRVGGVHRNAR